MYPARDNLLDPMNKIQHCSDSYNYLMQTI